MKPDTEQQRENARGNAGSAQAAFLRQHVLMYWFLVGFVLVIIEVILMFDCALSPCRCPSYPCILRNMKSNGSRYHL